MMSHIRKLVFFFLAVGFFVPADPVSYVIEGAWMHSAQAVIGRPATPVSVAGVARRTTRRCVTGVYRC